MVNAAWETTGVFTEEERQLMIVLVTRAWVTIRNDPAMTDQLAECVSILRKLSGVDKRIVANG